MILALKAAYVHLLIFLVLLQVSQAHRCLCLSCSVRLRGFMPKLCCVLSTTVCDPIKPVRCDLPSLFAGRVSTVIHFFAKRAKGSATTTFLIAPDLDLGCRVVIVEVVGAVDARTGNHPFPVLVDVFSKLHCPELRPQIALRADQIAQPRSVHGSLVGLWALRANRHGPTFDSGRHETYRAIFAFLADAELVL